MNNQPSLSVEYMKGRANYEEIAVHSYNLSTCMLAVVARVGDTTNYRY